MRGAVGKFIESVLVALGIGVAVHQLDKTGMPHLDPEPPPRPEAPTEPVPWWGRGRKIPLESPVVVPDATSVRDGGWPLSDPGGGASIGVVFPGGWGYFPEPLPIGGGGGHASVGPIEVLCGLPSTGCKEL